MTDEYYMKTALNLALRGAGHVSPNPLVGAVIVKDGRIIGRGWHAKFGGPHAERAALASCTEPTEGASIYVTLEPCCHYGKTPPCTEAIIASGISRVFVGSGDPNPLVAGGGIEILRKNNIEVVENVLRAECDEINAPFFHYIKTKTPYVILKYAMTLDGKTATRAGLSKWITGETARERVHRDRGRYSAIMVGVGTVLADNPTLDCRAEGGRNPVRIICDTNLRTPLGSKIVATARDIPTYIATARGGEKECKAYEDAGVKILRCETENGRISLRRLMSLLGEMGIDSVILEGGGELCGAAFESKIINRVQAYMAPKLFVGAAAHVPIGGAGIEIPSEAARIENKKVTMLGGDILIEGDVSYVHGDR